MHRGFTGIVMPNPFRVGIITQEDPFFLAEAVTYLQSIVPKGIEMVCAVVFAGSPFGQRMTFRRRVARTLKVFGLRFFMHYLWFFLWYKLDPKKSVKKVLHASGTPVIEDIQSINSDDAIRRVMYYRPDLLVSIGGNQIFKKKIIETVPCGILNLHTSLLPRYRGLMPTFWALKNGETETGVSVFLVNEGIDAGDIIVQKRVAIGDKPQAQLIQETKRAGMKALVEAILAIKTNTVTKMPNPDELSTYYPFPTREDVKEFYRSGKRFF
jgi:methionyl-tRNA formyltransferase